MDGDRFKVTRWRRYGRDRLYVERADGTRLGWGDLGTDELHPLDQGWLPELACAVQDWKAAAALAARQPLAGQAVSLETEASATSVVSPAPVTPSVDNHPVAGPLALPVLAQEPLACADLDTNQPGAAARQQAQAARQAAPVRTVIARVLGVHTEERAWRIGADGEEKVAAQLARVAKKDPRWRFLHAIPVGEHGSDIDHLAIGPGGVFTINAKHHRRAKIWVGGNTFMVNGQRQPYVRNSRHEAARATRLLTAAVEFPVEAHGVVVTVNADDVVIKQQPSDVTVVPRMQIARWLRRRPTQLSDGQVQAIYEAARRSITWRHA